mgnify:CR=1 FL=1
MLFLAGFTFAALADLIAYKNKVLEDTLAINYSVMFLLLLIAVSILTIFSNFNIILLVLGSICETVLVKEVVIKKLNK